MGSHHVVCLSFAASGASTIGAPLSFFWSFGDGTTAHGRVVTKAYATAGVFSVTLTATDGTGFAQSASTTAAIGGAALGLSQGLTVTQGTTIVPACGVGSVYPYDGYSYGCAYPTAQTPFVCSVSGVVLVNGSTYTCAYGTNIVPVTTGTFVGSCAVYHPLTGAYLGVQPCAK